MNRGWKRLKGSEMISLTLMELLLLLSFVLLAVVKGFYDGHQEINTLIKRVEGAVLKGEGKLSANEDNPAKQLEEAIGYIDNLPPGWTTLTMPTVGEAEMLRKIEVLKDRIKELTKRGDPEQLTRDKQQLEEENKKLKKERGEIWADLKKADPKTAKKYLDKPPGGEGGAPGKKPCWKEDGKILTLYSITIGEDEFFVKPDYPSTKEREATILPVKIARDGQKLSTAQFHEQMRLINEVGAKNSCTYYVKVRVNKSISATSSTKGINAVHSYFYQIGSIQIVQE